MLEWRSMECQSGHVHQTYGSSASRCWRRGRGFPEPGRARRRDASRRAPSWRIASAGSSRSSRSAASTGRRRSTERRCRRRPGRPRGRRWTRPRSRPSSRSKLKKQKVLAGWKDGFFLESPNGDFKLKLRGYIQADSARLPERGRRHRHRQHLHAPRAADRRGHRLQVLRLQDHAGLRRRATRTLQDAYGGVNYLNRGASSAPASSSRRSASSGCSRARTCFSSSARSARTWPRTATSASSSPATSRTASSATRSASSTVTWTAARRRRAGNDATRSPDSAASSGRACVLDTPSRRLGAEVRHDALSKLGFGLAGHLRAPDGGRQPERGQLPHPRRGDLLQVRHLDLVVEPQDIVCGRRAVSPSAAGLLLLGTVRHDGRVHLSTTGGAAHRRPRRSSGDPVTTVNEPKLRNDGWFVQASWVLTGEDASYRGVTPISPFDPL